LPGAADIGGLLKPLHLLIPAVALVAVLAWNLSRWQAVSTQESENRALKERIGAVSAGIDGAPVGSPRNEVKTGGSGGKSAIQWKSLSQKIAEMSDDDDMGDMNDLLELQSRLYEMSREEIIAALNEVSGLEMTDEARETIEELLVGPLIELDPAYVLNAFGDRIPDEDDGVAWQLSSALDAWARLDAAAATSWFDRQIAGGLFDSKSLDGRSEMRIEFEGALAGVLLDSNAEEAGRRIAALPEDQRREALEMISFSELGKGGQAAYAGLVRSLVPVDEQGGSFAHVIAELVPEGGYERVAGFLDQVQATPEERAVSAREAANAQIGEISYDREVTREDVDAMRAWLDRQAPGTSDRMTGEALAEASQDSEEFGFAQASKLALEYHQSSGNDEVLIAFLESYAARSNLEEALPLAEKISDPQKREEILEQLK
jgi:hypothetical protein